MRITFLTKMIFASALIINLCSTYAQYGNSQRYESVAEIVANKVLVDYEEEYKFMFRGRYLTVFYNNDSNTEIFNLYAADKGELKYQSTSNNGTASVYSNWNNDGYGNIYYETPVSINVNSDNIWFNGTADFGTLETKKSPETYNNYYYEDEEEDEEEEYEEPEGWFYFEREDDRGMYKRANTAYRENYLDLEITNLEWEDDPIKFYLSFDWNRLPYEFDNSTPDIQFYFNNQEPVYIAKEIVDRETLRKTWNNPDMEAVLLKTAIQKSQPEIEIELIEILDLLKKSNTVTFEIKTSPGDISKFQFSLKGSSKAINSLIPGHSEMVKEIREKKSRDNTKKEEKEESKPWWKFWDY